VVDEFQDRYLAHQARKREVLRSIMEARHSNRIFADTPVPAEVVAAVLETQTLCPSSCDRHGVSVTVVDDRDGKALLGGLLVGGVGWIHRAPVVALLIADPDAYKAAGEIDFMPYLDAGVVVQQFYLAATAEGLHCAFANPNIRPHNRAHFAATFGDGVFCGAFAFGWPP
jgi:nitroreductase